jgi:hypothetical protein
MVRSKECIEYYNFKDDISLYGVESLKKTLKSKVSRTLRETLRSGRKESTI